MNLQAFGLLLISILANIAVQFSLKMSTTKLGKIDGSNVGEMLWHAVATPGFWAGVVGSVVSAIAYFFVLTGLELSVAGPASALVYIFSVLMGHFLFKEAVPFSHLVGLSLIVCGVVLVGAKA